MDMLLFRGIIINHLIKKNPPPGPQTPAQPDNRKKHKFSKKEGSVRTSRKRCLPCYKKITEGKGAATARKLAKRVSTFCNMCEGNPPMCLTCFNEKH